MFYDNFCAICKEKGLKVTNVVNELGLSSGNMTNWKNGRTPKTDVLKKIAEFLDVTTDYLLGNSDERKPINRDITDNDIKFALFGGDSEYISDESYEDVKAFAKIVAEKEKRKRAEMNELK